MNYNKKDIMEIVEIILGEDADGVYVSQEVVDRDVSVGDTPVYSSLGKMPFEIMPIEDYYVEMGMSKICIIPKRRTDWVIKIPITGIYRENWSDDEEDFCDYNSGNFLGCEKIGKAICDLCDEERVLYADSSDELKRVLANVEYVGEYNGIPVYVQERVKVIEFLATTKDKKFFLGVFNFISNEIDRINEIMDDSKDSSNFSDSFIANVILKIGFLKAVKVFEEISREITDIHEWNYGYDYDGNAKLFDYSGYSRQYTYEFFKKGEVA